MTHLWSEIPGKAIAQGYGGHEGPWHGGGHLHKDALLQTDQRNTGADIILQREL